jgi:hypothetical protein
MVRNGLGVDARGGRVRAASATSSARLVVLDDAPFLDVGEALRVALAAARANFGEPEAIALVHDDDVNETDLEELRRSARSAGVGEVRLVADSVARPLAENEDVPPALIAATGAAIWLVRERRGVVVPPVSLPGGDRRADGAEGRRQMSEFGDGRTMADFASGSQMSDFGDGRTMGDFGDGRTMGDFGGPRRTRRSRLVVAAVAAAVIIVAGAVAAVGLSNGSTDVDSVAATGTTDSAAEASTTTTGAPIEAGSQTSLDVTTTTAANSAATTTVATVTTTTIPTTTRTYEVVARLDSYATDAPVPRLKQGDSATATVTLTCNAADECTGSVVVPVWDVTHAFAGNLVDGSLDDSSTFQPDECVDPVEATFAFSGAFEDSSTSGRLTQSFKPRVCRDADGNERFHEDIAISFATPAQIR